MFYLRLGTNKRSYFFLVPLPPLIGRATTKITFFCGFPKFVNLLLFKSSLPKASIISRKLFSSYFSKTFKKFLKSTIKILYILWFSEKDFLQIFSYFFKQYSCWYNLLCPYYCRSLSHNFFIISTSILMACYRKHAKQNLVI